MTQNRDIEAIYPLSPAQEGILFHSLYAPQSGVYLVQVSYQLRGNLDTTALRQAWQHVVNRHPILRTFFVWERRDKPLQLVRAQVEVPWVEYDWLELDEAEQAAKVEELWNADREREFDLSKAPLMRLALCRRSEDTYQLFWSFHHILLDGWSLPLLLNEVMAAYKAYSQGHDLQLAAPRPYRDYINWLRQQDLSQAESFWRETLKDFTAPTALAVDHAHGSLLDDKPLYEEQSLRLSKEVTSALYDIAQRNGLTINTLTQGAYALLLSHYSSNPDVVFGIVTSGRPAALEGVESMLGLFINTLPMRVQVAPHDSLVPWLQRLQKQQADIMRYEYSPLVEVRAWSDAPKDSPLFENIFVFENYPVIRNSHGQEDVEIVDIRVSERTNYPLSMIVGPGEQLYLRVSYESRRFDASAMARLLRHFETLLTQIATRPEQRLARFSILTRAERNQLLLEWNDTATDYPTGQTLHGLFEAQAARTPDAVALLFEEQSLRYADLDRRANQLARRLRRLGVGREVPVGVFMERSIEMVVSLLGILKAGGAYLPLDPEYPRERLAVMLDEAQPPAVLTQQHLRANLPPHQAQVVCVDSDWQDVESESAERLEEVASAGNAAYVIYTSGSTGRPKGVINTHRGISNRLLWMQETYNLSAADSVLQKTPFSFDVSVWEFFWPLMTGARLVMARPKGHQDSAYMVNVIAERGITTIHFVPSMLQVFLGEQGLERCACLKRVICSGEALPAGVAKRFGERLEAELYNLYGPTEAAVDVTHWTCGVDGPEEVVPIGRPIANTEIYLLTKEMQPVPVGVTGELYIGGEGLARGYLKRPELTAEKFIPNPFGEGGGRLYRTGDLARYRSDGAIEFIGRSDHQVKIRGFRIELSEIETVLAQHPAVRETVVLAREDAFGDKSLAAYLTPKSQGEISTAELREFLRTKLPHYMIPAAFVELGELPLTSNGKVDRRALLTVESNSEKFAEKSDVAFTPPRTEIERTIAAAWREVLHVEAVGAHDNFFDLGGHSLRMVQLRGKLQELLQTDVSMNDLFKYPTVSSMAEFFSRGAADGVSADGNDGRIEKLREGKDRLRQRSQQKQRTFREEHNERIPSVR